MHLSYHIDRESRVVVVTCGNTSFEHWRSTMISIFADPRYQPGFALLVDARSATLTPSTEDVRGVVDFIASHRAMVGEAKWAVVVERIAGYGMARMAEALAQIAGVDLRAFKSFEEGLGWLTALPVHADEQHVAQVRRAPQ